MKIAELYDAFLNSGGIETDSRKLLPDQIFFALKGPSFNGNLFAEQALQKGAARVVMDEPSYTHEKVFLVHDVLETLQLLALHHRKQFNIPFIAITGSNGKTTTKELLHAVLSKKYKTYTTKGNLNNHIGIPLTILAVQKDAEMAVIEMGANHQKEIESYCSFTLPTHGIITNCGKAHLEGFGGEEGVRKGKGELFEFLKQHNGTAFIYDDYDYLHSMSKGLKNVVWYGSENGLIKGKALKALPYLHIEITDSNHKINVETKLVGAYNLPNALAAFAVGKYFNISWKEMKAAVEEYMPSNSRSQLLQKDGNFFIMDAYNANPTSMKAAIENFAKQEHCSKKILMLGAMMELGNQSLDEHQKIIDLINEFVWDEVILVGGDFLKAEHSFTTFADVEEAAKWFKKKQFQNTCILIKGSRSTQMEKIIA